MIDVDRLAIRFPRLFAALKKRVILLRKAITFALIGLFNTFLDAGIFFAAYACLISIPALREAMTGLSALCGCGPPSTLTLIASNMMGWTVGVTSSYVLNSSITFAAESGRKLHWRAYLTFVASGVLGLIANTTTLVVVAKVAPVWAAKFCALIVSFAVNFSMSHLVVFRARPHAHGRR